MKRLAAILLALALCAAGTARAALPRINIDVRDADLADVIALLSAEAHVNVVTDASVHPQRVTLHLRDVTFDDALTVLLEAHALQVRRQGNVLIVGASESMNRRYGTANDPRSPQTAVMTLKNANPEDVAKELQAGLPDGTVIVADKRTSTVIVTAGAQTAFRAKQLVAALDVPAYRNSAANVAHTYALRFVRPSDIGKELKGALPDGSYVVDEAQNAIVVTGNEEVQNTAALFLKSIDVATPQVMFEVKVADVQPIDENSNVGIQLGGIDFGGQPLNGGTTYSFAKSSIAVNARINALLTQGRAEILATPRLVTLNNREADLLIGQTYPVVYYDARLGGQQVQFVEIGVKLRLTPTIGADGSVIAEMHPEYSAIQDFQGGYPIIANRKVDSTLRVRDNETIVLGGLLRDIDAETVTRIPGLSNLPVFGKVFRNRQHTRQRDEIVFLITPHIIPPGGPVPQK